MVVTALGDLMADPTASQMALNFACIGAGLIGCSSFLQRRKVVGRWSTWFPAGDKQGPRAVRLTEQWFLMYACFWIAWFAVIVGLQLYRAFGEAELFGMMLSLAAPLLLQPFLRPELTGEAGVPLLQRYSFRANLWIAIFSFIGNYWYTHYFYSVLGAKYTMRSWDLNGVPIPMYLATHFYFAFYHALSNCLLRRIRSMYVPSVKRDAFICMVVLCASYTTAFMETLTIARYECYSFTDWHSACTVGSAFYGIYFIVSFPMFSHLARSEVRGVGGNDVSWTCVPVGRVAIEALGTGMAVLCLLDFVRVWRGEDLTISLQRTCKVDPATTCPPWQGHTC